MHINYHIKSIPFKYHNECDQKCENGYCTPEWTSDNHKNTKSKKIEGGSILYPSNCGKSCKYSKEDCRTNHQACKDQA